MITDQQESAVNERRLNPELRVIFTEAYEIIRPFFDKGSSWGGLPLDHLAFRALQDRYPTLTGEQVYVIVSASKRVISRGGIPAP